jgi:hypothetical protein
VERREKSHFFFSLLTVGAGAPLDEARFDIDNTSAVAHPARSIDSIE